MLLSNQGNKSLDSANEIILVTELRKDRLGIDVKRFCSPVRIFFSYIEKTDRLWSFMIRLASTRFLVRSMAVALCFACCAGCSEAVKVYPVAGRVVFEDGAPADTGVIEFRSLDQGVNARARIQKDGSFQLTTYEMYDGAIAGKHQAIIVQQIIAEVPAPKKFVAQPENAPQPQVHHAHRVVAKEFSSYDSTPLEYTVEPDGKNVFEVKVH